MRVAVDVVKTLTLAPTTTTALDFFRRKMHQPPKVSRLHRHLRAHCLRPLCVVLVLTSDVSFCSVLSSSSQAQGANLGRLDGDYPQAHLTAPSASERAASESLASPRLQHPPPPPSEHKRSAGLQRGGGQAGRSYNGKGRYPARSKMWRRGTIFWDILAGVLLIYRHQRNRGSRLLFYIETSLT